MMTSSMANATVPVQSWVTSVITNGKLEAAMFSEEFEAAAVEIHTQQ